MVLLHGGGGTAFDEWVRVWNRLGFAAIAMDLCGCIPETPKVGDGSTHERLPDGGPPGWDSSFDRAEDEPADQWPFHAVSAASRARELLASQPGVDGERIGVTGISWGGYLTCLAAGADRRFGCAVPVYGCGFLGESSVWKDQGFGGVAPSRVARWLELWDPRQHLPRAAMPMCWVTGTNDFAYPLDSVQKSYRLPRGERALAIRVEMPHSHVDGWAPPDIGVFAASVFVGGAPLPRIVRHGTNGLRLWLELESSRPVLSAELVYTRASGHWSDRRWNRLPAALDHSSVSAVAPELATAAFINLYDDRGCVASTPHVRGRGPVAPGEPGEDHGEHGGDREEPCRADAEDHLDPQEVA
jgi:dienelactone hydrolase